MRPFRRQIAVSLAAVAALVAIVALGSWLAGSGASDRSTARATAQPGSSARALAVVSGSGRLAVLVRPRSTGTYRVHASVTPRGRRRGVPLTTTTSIRLRGGRAQRVALTVRPSAAANLSVCDPPLIRVSYRRTGSSARRRQQEQMRPARSPDCRELLIGKKTRFTATSSPPIDPSQAVAFGTRSHWRQPWRAWLSTQPATTLRDAAGMNFNVPVDVAFAAAQLLRRAGIRRARVEISWPNMSFDRPSVLADSAAPGMRARLLALKSAGIRPLILLNSNSGGPVPFKRLEVNLTATAAAGARQISVDAATAAAIVPGRTGIDRPRKLAGILFSDVRGRTVTLAAPLPGALPAGPQVGSILRFAPFKSPLLADGSPNPAFEETMGPWLSYVGGVTSFAKDVLGGQGFDVEIWNELSSGADFLSDANYYSPPPARNGDINAVLTARTVAFLRDPARGFTKIGITNGFASQTPFRAPVTSPDGLTALSKHPYSSAKQFPNDALIDTIAPLDAAGQPDFTGSPKPGDPREVIKRDRFIPSYRSFFPEYFLSAIQTEALTNDLSPTVRTINGTPHGATTTTPGGQRLQTWLTEMALDPAGADPGIPAAVGAPSGLSAFELAHLKAKTALRTYAAFIGKGVTAVHMFAAAGTPLNLISDNYSSAVRAKGGKDPGDRAGGSVIGAIGRFTAFSADARRIGSIRRLTLARVADAKGAKQFAGDGSTAHPPLYDRDVLAFFPFQLGPRSWVVPTYVMTRNLAKRYRSNPPRGSSGSDLPDEPFELTIRGLEGKRAEAALFDPLSNQPEPVQIIRRARNGVTLRLLETDSPRMLVLSDG